MTNIEKIKKSLKKFPDTFLAENYDPTDYILIYTSKENDIRQVIQEMESKGLRLTCTEDCDEFTTLEFLPKTKKKKGRIQKLEWLHRTKCGNPVWYVEFTDKTGKTISAKTIINGQIGYSVENYKNNDEVTIEYFTIDYKNIITNITE